MAEFDQEFGVTSFFATAPNQGSGSVGEGVGSYEEEEELEDLMSMNPPTIISRDGLGRVTKLTRQKPFQVLASLQVCRIRND